MFSVSVCGVCARAHPWLKQRILFDTVFPLASCSNPTFIQYTMHFAYPPRKSSNPPSFRPKSSQLSLLRRSRIKSIAIGVLFFLAALYLLLGRKKSDPYHEHVPSGYPSVVLVTVVNPGEHSDAYIEKVKQNRQKYATRHGEFSSKSRENHPREQATFARY